MDAITPNQPVAQPVPPPVPHPLSTGAASSPVASPTNGRHSALSPAGPDQRGGLSGESKSDRPRPIYKMKRTGGPIRSVSLLTSTSASRPPRAPGNGMGPGSAARNGAVSAKAQTPPPGLIRVKGDMTDDPDNGQDNSLGANASPSRGGDKRARDTTSDNLSGMIQHPQKRAKPATSPLAHFDQTTGNPSKDADGIGVDNGSCPMKLDIAEGDRPYTMINNESGGYQQTYGALIPAQYKMGAEVNKPWVCSVRGCRGKFSMLSLLGQHFMVAHQGNTYHDNGDGTLASVGSYGNKSAGSQNPPIVVSKALKDGNGAAATAPSTDEREAPEVAEHDTDGPSTPLPAIGRDSNGRPYDYWIDMTGKLMNAQGALLPEGYIVNEKVWRPWKCPVDTCEQRFNDLNGLGLHFKYTYRGSYLEDSLDGTFKITGSYRRGKGKPVPPLVVSRGQKVATSTPSRPNTARKSPRSKQRAAHLSDLAPLDASEPMPTQGNTSTALSPPRPDFSAPLPGNAELMWKFVTPFLKRTHPDRIPNRQYVRDLLPLPRVRDLVWNEAWKRSRDWTDVVPRDITSLIMHVTGSHAPVPCTRCERGLGPYKGCVLLSTMAPVTPHVMIYSCANCLYHAGQSTCSLQQYCKTETAKLFPDLDVDRLRRILHCGAATKTIIIPKDPRDSKDSEGHKHSKSVNTTTDPTTLQSSQARPKSPARQYHASLAEVSSRNRGARPTYNIKELSRATQQSMAPTTSSRRSSVPVRATTDASVEASESRRQERRGTDSVSPRRRKGQNGIGEDITRSSPRNPLELGSRATAASSIGTSRARKASTLGSPDGDEEESGERDWETPSARQQEAQPRAVTARPAHGPVISQGDLARVGPEMLEMEDWEVGPGHIRAKTDEPDNLAFSNAYLMQNQMVPIGYDISFRVEFLKPGCSLSLKQDSDNTRICSIASGKVKVTIDDTTFTIGPNGIIKVRPGASAVIENRLYLDACLHISAFSNQ